MTTGVEQYTYSIAWLAFGVVLLGIGILFNSQRARLASAVVIALTILKAFLIDMSTLTGVYRALSFMCLGLVLVAIGWLYQRILFRRQRRRRPCPSRSRARRPGCRCVVASKVRAGCYGQPGFRYQAALTVSRNLPTSSLSRLLSPDSDCAADSTCEEAEPVSLAPRCTSVMLEETCWVPCAACCTLREISCVAAPCSSTAAAMVDEISDSFSMVPLISLIAFDRVPASPPGCR